MLNRSLESYFQSAFGHAKRLGHSWMGTEHLLKSVLETSWIQVWLKSQKIDWQSSLVAPLDNFLSQGGEFKEHRFNTPWSSPIPNFQSKQALSRASAIGHSCQKPEAAPLYLLVAIWAGDSGFAGELLRQSAMGLDAILEFLSKVQRVEYNLSSSKGKEHKSVPPEAYGSSETQGAGWPEEEESAFERGWVVNLTEQASLGLLEPMVGREEDLARALQILCRKKKCNPLLLGEAGVGKSTLIDGLALLLAQSKKVPKALMGAVVYALDLPALLSGTKYRGDLEKRFKALIRELSSLPKVILSIDEIHLLVGAGNSSGGHIDLASLFKPILAQGSLKVVGATTVREYQATLEKDKALARRFQKVLIHEPNREEAFQMIKGLKATYESHHNVRYSNEVIQKAVELASQYIHDRALPDKALDLIDELGSSYHIGGGGRRCLKADDLSPVLHRLFQRPVWGPFSLTKIDFEALGKHLNENLVGQPEAVHHFVRLVKSACCSEFYGGWQREQASRPVGSALLVGPTGVGKTYLPKLAANFLNLSLLRFDMSEYAESHSISRLLGAPPGYVGHESSGSLVQMVKESPHSILLFDEIEKAHPDLIHALLQVLDEGFLTDHQGRKVTFQHSMLLLTSNLGAETYDKGGLGFHELNPNLRIQQSLAAQLPTEFRSRIDQVLIFKPLSKASLHSVLEKQLARIQAHLKGQSLGLTLHPDLMQLWIEQAFESKLGARGLLNLLKRELAEIALGSQALPKGARIHLQRSSGNATQMQLHALSACTPPSKSLSESVSAQSELKSKF